MFGGGGDALRRWGGPALEEEDGSSVSVASTPRTSGPTVSALAFGLGNEDYGGEAAGVLGAILTALARAGFAKAHDDEYTAFERVLGGLVWLLQRLVRREDAERGRVQWDVLFQPHAKMRPRLGLAQEVVRCIEALPHGCPCPIQPHQLLLQDFGDIGAVRRLVDWLVEQETPHLTRLQDDRGYLEVLRRQDQGTASLVPSEASIPLLKPEVQHLRQSFHPRRRWRCVAPDAPEDSEDAQIQRCLLEYGERVVAAAATTHGPAGDPQTTRDIETPAAGGDIRHALMAELATSVTALSQRPRMGPHASSSVRPSKARDKTTREFDAQYERLAQQAIAEQETQLAKQREREAKLLEQVVAVSETTSGSHEQQTEPTLLQAEFQGAQRALQECEAVLSSLVAEKTSLKARRDGIEQHYDAVNQAIEDVRQETEALDSHEQANTETQQHLARLRELVARNEAFKKERSQLKATYKHNIEQLEKRVRALRQQAAKEVASQDEETLRLKEIEQMHAQMSAKHKDLRLALARQTREVHRYRRAIDDVPTRVELVQYEKRFVELYDEVAMTLEETRKYYCIYNTLKTTHEFLEKEIALLQSIYENFDVAMASKAATAAFFSQLTSIVHNVDGTVAKQQSLRAEHQARIDTLDSKYQLLLEQERHYVNAIRDFQRECERNEKLAARLTNRQLQLERVKSAAEASSSMIAVGANDVVI